VVYFRSRYNTLSVFAALAQFLAILILFFLQWIVYGTLKCYKVCSYLKNSHIDFRWVQEWDLN